MVPPDPVNRLLVVARGLRSLADELEEIQGQPAANLLWWADEIDRAVVDLRNAAGVTASRGPLRTPSRGA